MIAGTADITLTRSSRIHSASPTGSTRSMQTRHAPICTVLTGPRTMRLRMVRGSTTPRRTSVSGWDASATAPTSRRLCWLCTTPLGWPVVPLVYAIAAGSERVDVGLGCGCGIGGGHPVGPRAGEITRFRVDDDPQYGELVTSPLDLGGRGAVTDEERHAGVVEQVALLGERERAIDADPHRAEVHGREERHHQLGVVGHAPGDAVARLDAGIGQGHGGRGGPGRRARGT